jgi:hypothetical protein
MRPVDTGSDDPPFPGKRRRPFFDEMGHAFLEILGLQTQNQLVVRCGRCLGKRLEMLALSRVRSVGGFPLDSLRRIMKV